MSDAPIRTAAYRDMDGPTLLAALGDDASKWAAVFMEIIVERGAEIDEGLMINWFANAIEGSHDHRALSSRVEPEGWREIESAPHDKDVLLWAGFAQTGRFVTEDDWSGWVDSYEGADLPAPTHWLPLPLALMATPPTAPSTTPRPRNPARATAGGRRGERRYALRRCDQLASPVVRLRGCDGGVSSRGRPPHRRA